jgi:hypothetical protein
MNFFDAVVECTDYFNAAEVDPAVSKQDVLDGAKKRMSILISEILTSNGSCRESYSVVGWARENAVFPATTTTTERPWKSVDLELDALPLLLLEISKEIFRVRERVCERERDRVGGGVWMIMGGAWLLVMAASVVYCMILISFLWGCRS